MSTCHARQTRDLVFQPLERRRDIAEIRLLTLGDTCRFAFALLRDNTDDWLIGTRRRDNLGHPIRRRRGHRVVCSTMALQRAPISVVARYVVSGTATRATGQILITSDLATSTRLTRRRQASPLSPRFYHGGEQKNTQYIQRKVWKGERPDAVINSTRRVIGAVTPRLAFPRKSRGCLSPIIYGARQKYEPQFSWAILRARQRNFFCTMDNFISTIVLLTMLATARRDCSTR